MPRRQPPLGVERLEDRAVPATFFVDNNADAGPGSLRQALADADLSPTADVVQFRGLLSGTITLTSPLTLDGSVDLQGPGASAVTVAGKNAFTVFNVVSIGNPVIRIAGLTITAGNAVSGDGGGIINTEDLTLDGVVVTGNTAVNGGGVWTSGPLRVLNSTFRGNVAAGSGGAVATGDFSTGNPSVSVTNSTFLGNTSGADGGAIESLTVLSVAGTTFQANTAAGFGGGVHHAGTDPAASMVVSGSLFTANTAGGDGGGVSIADDNGAELLTDVTFFQNASAAGQGGGLFSAAGAGVARLVHVTATGNQATTGGGVSSEGGVLLLNSIVTGNTATGPGSPASNVPIADVLLVGSEGGNVLGQADQTSASGFQPSDVAGVQNAGLGTLGNYGGPTRTIQLLAGSPALGRGLAVGAPVRGLPPDTAPPTDARGLARPSGGSIDAGAFQAQRPTGNPDVFTTVQGRPLTVSAPGLLANDAANDIYGPLVATRFFPPSASAGSLAANPDGSFTFTPAPGFTGAVRASYFASDGVTATGPVPVSLIVTAATPPTANPDAFSIGTARVLSAPAPGVLANDVPGNAATTALTAALVTPPDASDGTLVLNPDGSFTFTAAATFDGTATFTYTASDGAAVSAPATVTITGGAAVRLFAVGSGAGLGSVPMVRVFNSDGSTRFDLIAFDPGFNGGVRVAVGDVTGDRIDDIVAGAGPGGAPHVVVFDGATGALLRSFYAYDPSFRSGAHVAVGDVLNADGVAEIVTGAGSSDTDAGGAPHVVVFDGRTGATLRSFYAYDAAFRGGVRVAVGTLDGQPRIVTAPGPSGGPDVRVFDPTSLAETARFTAFDPNYRGGSFVAVVGGEIVVSPDSFPDFAGSLLQDRFATLRDTAGGLGAGTASEATLTAPARLFAFTVLPGGAVQAAQTVDVDPGFQGGVRISAGTFGNRTGVFVATGPGGGGRLRFYPVGQGIEPATLDVPVFGANFPFSIYVGGALG